MIRLVAAVFAACLAGSAFAQTTPVLRATVLVASDVVQIGDLVDNVPPAKARIAIFRAPNLGETGAVPVARVMEALRPHDVVGVAAGRLSEVSVTRASRAVSGDEIRSRVAAILAERLRVADPANIAVNFDQPLTVVHLDPAQSGPLAATRLSYDSHGGRFDLTLRTAGSATLRLTGHASEAYDAVVATRPLARGDILRDGDVVLEKRAKSELQGEVVRDLAAAIGQAVQQPLRPGQPLRATDLSKPQLVKRNEPVLLLYEVPGIVLTARGRAEDSGALGDVVNITNIQSKRVVQGVVTAPGQVTVTSLTPRITTASANLAVVQRGADTDVARP
jgi:flagella basal body P-ring formation protein FlgA